MRILYVAHRIPYPPNKGDKIRSFNQIKFLGGRHEVHLACLADEPADLAYRPELTAYCRTVEAVYLNRRWARLRGLCYLPTAQPLTRPYFYAPALRRAIERLVRNYTFDLIYVFSSSMAQYVLDLSGVAKVLDMVDVDSDKWRQYALYTKWPRAGLYSLEWRRMRRYERQITDHFERTIVIAEPEASLLRAINPRAPVAVVPNGIDFDWFAHPGPWPGPPDWSALQPYVVFTGAMDYLPNVDGVFYFVDQVWPRLRRRLPALRFLIAGMNPVAEIRRLSQKDPNIIVTGYVPDIRPFLAHAAACVVPLRIARGVQNKILEAMAAGLPVVATERALEGLRVEKDHDVLVGNEAAALADALAHVIENPDRGRWMAENARQTLQAQYSWPGHLSRLENVLYTEYANYPRPSSPAPRPTAKLV